MEPYEDPDHPGNGVQHHTGKPCYYKCGRPAGTAWSPLLCQPCNAKRMARIDDSMKRIEEHIERVVSGP